MNSEKESIKSNGKGADTDRDLLKEITEAYLSLEERGKKVLFKFIYKNNPDAKKKIISIVSNMIGGIRPPTIWSRSSDKISKDIDMALCKDNLPLFFMDAIAEYIFTEKFDRIEWFKKYYRNYTKDSSAFKIKFLSDFPDDSFNGLALLIWDVFPSEQKEKCYNTYLISNLENKSNELNLFSERFKVLARVIQDAGDFNKETAKKALDSAHELISSLKQDIEKNGKELGIPIIGWKNRKELDDQIQKIKDAIDDSTKDVQKIATFLIGLSKLLKNLVIEHRSIMEKQRYSELRNKSSLELEEASNSQGKISINGPDSPLPWLEWIGSLSGKDLDLQGKNLEDQNLPNLAQFIHIFDINWLPKDSAIESETIKDEQTHMECQVKLAGGRRLRRKK